MRILLAGGVAAGSLLSTNAIAAQPDGAHAVFVMTNDALRNEVVAYPRANDGVLLSPTHYRTGGRGSGGTVDPLISQGSLTLSPDGTQLLAVNAGSGTLSLFRVDGDRLELTDQVPTQGSEPNAVAQYGDLVYVLNTAGSSSVVGFRIEDNHLRPIPNSIRFLSGNAVTSSSLTFSVDGSVLLVAERGTSQIDSFRVNADGTLAKFVATPSAGAGLFALTVAPNGTVIAAETGGGGNPSAESSYAIQPDGALVAISTSLPTLGAANCWNVVTPDGRFVYTSNSGSSSIAGFSIGADGALTPIPGTLVGHNPAGSTNLDIAVSRDGRFLYSLNARTGTVGIFAIRSSDGSLTNLGTVSGLHGNTGLNGIAAN
ncbi:MAG TPA: beta-propeller fold lactonase family protein [Steroidobacteraceae bacterium]